MTVGEFARKYVTRGKGLAAAVGYHGILVDDEEMCRRILTGDLSHMYSVREGFTLRMDVSVVELEQALVVVDEPRK